MGTFYFRFTACFMCHSGGAFGNMRKAIEGASCTTFSWHLKSFELRVLMPLIGVDVGIDWHPIICTKGLEALRLNIVLTR